ncbi:RNA polymerase II-associated protein 3-like isoform X1 [Periplaneta americana]|uniref:RNA polymerase II-associated protein 3-like isoform X1 n=1 Tax=Periplaneta americana TaxID=6978 RepID=UPI0037E75E88
MDSVLLQKQVRDNAEDFRSYLEDLKSWEAEMKRKESVLDTSASGDKALPPVRSKMRKECKEQKIKAEKKSEKPTRISGSDYASWDKFDVDKACEELETEKQEESEDDDDEIEDIDEVKLREEAVYEKEMGNDFVKKQKWKEAIQCYSRAIKCYAYDAIFYANRALCYLKTGDNRSAEVDCTTALQLDPNYVKAYQRRAMARAALGQLQEARVDLLRVMELEPKNVQSKGELLKLEKKLNTQPKAKTGKESSTTVSSKSSVGQKTEKGITSAPKSKKEVDDQLGIESRTGNEIDTLAYKDRKEENRVIPQTADDKSPIATAAIEKQAKCSANQEIVDRGSGDSRLGSSVLKEYVWPTKEVNLVKPIHKPPHLRSKKPLKRIEIKEIDNSSSKETRTIVTASSSKEEPSDVLLDNEKPVCARGQNTVNLSSEGDEGNKVELLSEEGSSATLKVTSEEKSTEIPPVPNNSVQFLVAWKKIKSDPELGYLYLKQIPGIEFPRIFRDSLESGILSDIISTIKLGFLPHKEPVLPYLEGLSNVRRFSALAMFLSENDKAGINTILEYAIEQGECSREETIHLKKKFELC